jgi:hypothetical protein
MASRAQAIHDYSFGYARTRPRHEVWYPADEDPVVLPRSEHWSGSGVLAAAAAVATVLVVGFGYVMYTMSQPTLRPTQESGIVSSWQPDPEIARSKALIAAVGPSLSLRSIAEPPSEQVAPQADSPNVVTTPTRSNAVVGGSSEVLINDSAPGAQESFPQPSTVDSGKVTAPSDATAPPAVYPNPTTTPPDQVAPATPEAPAPSLDPENPYR